MRGGSGDTQSWVKLLRPYVLASDFVRKESIENMDLKKFKVFQSLDPVFIADVKYACFIGIDTGGESLQILCTFSQEIILSGLL